MAIELIQGPSAVALQLITHRMRQVDQDEIYATNWSDDPDDLVQKIVRAGPIQWIAWKDSDPVAAIGLTPMWPSVWGVWSFGTDRWTEVAGTLTKHARRVMMPLMLEMGAHRIQAYASEDHEASRKWMKHLGAKQGEPLEYWGKNGKTYFCYWWDRQALEENARHRPVDSLETDDDKDR